MKWSLYRRDLTNSFYLFDGRVFFISHGWIKFSIEEKDNIYFSLSIFVLKYWNSLFSKEQFESFFSDSYLSKSLMQLFLSKNFIFVFNQKVKNLIEWDGNNYVIKDYTESIKGTQIIKDKYIKKNGFVEKNSSLNALKIRSSCRNFTSNKIIPKKIEDNILAIISEHDRFNWSPGWYYWCFGINIKKISQTNVIVSYGEINQKIDLQKLYECLNWLGIFCLDWLRSLYIIANYSLFYKEKYWTKAYDLMYLEWWIVSQNVIIYWIEKWLKSCQYNWFNEENLKKLCSINNANIHLLTWIFMWYGKW
jgi:hypothetical protein